MKRRAFVGVVAWAMVFTTACSSLTVVSNLDDQRFTSEARPVAHLSARVGGVYLFYWLPLVTGNSEQPDRIRFFRNEPDVDRVVHMVTKKARNLGRRT